MSSDMMEMMVYSQMFGNTLGNPFGGAFGGQLWLYVAYLVCLFAVIIYKPERIRNLSMYRRACYLFGISVLLPTIISLVTGAIFASAGPAFAVPGRQGFNQPGGASFMQFLGADGGVVIRMAFQILHAIGPILFGISVICALISLVPSFIPPPDFEVMGSEPQPRRRVREAPSSLKPDAPGAHDVEIFEP